MDHIKPRTTGKDYKISEDEFRERFDSQFRDPTFDPLREAIADIRRVAWENYKEGRKAPQREKAGPGYADPEYELSVEWIKTKKKIDDARKIHKDPSAKTNVLLILASDRNEGTCPSEISKTLRLGEIAQKSLEESGIEVTVLDLSLVTVEYGKTIHPCKGCVSTAMPLCHFPCSCYPNSSLGQNHDWMNDIYPLWIRAHGIMIISPVYWHQAPGALKNMIDRLVCADGGNEDPTSTQGKKAELAKKIELEGWHYPRHLEGRLFSVIVHGDTTGIDDLKTALTDWLEEMNLLPAGLETSFARFVDYYGPYATSHEGLDKDRNFQAEVRNAAVGLGKSLQARRESKLDSLMPATTNPRPK